MGEFDDVLAMEPGDEWDDHVIGREPDADELHGPLQATLRLPNALVELRGASPPGVLDALADLTDERLVLLGEVGTITLSVRRGDDHWVLGGHGAPTATSRGEDDLLRAVVARLEHLAVDTDPMRLHLDVAAVRHGDTGIVVVDAHGEALDGAVVVVGPDDGAPGADTAARDDRTLVVADLLELGADFVTAGLLSLLPGSRTVFGHPSPPSTSTHPPVRASSVAPVAPYCHVDHVVVLRRRPGVELSATELDVGSAAVQMLLSGLDVGRIGPGALDVVAQVVSDARCTVVEYSEVRGVAASIVALPAAGPRPLTVVHRFDRDADAASGSSHGSTGGAPIPAAVRRGRASLRVARFETSGALHDGRSGSVMALTAGELDAIEARLVATKGSAKDTGTDAVALGRLAAAGIEVPDAARVAPGIEAFGLPNCPVGASAAAMWTADAVQRTLSAASAPGADVPGAVAQAVERGVVTLPASEQGSIMDRHELARRLVALVESTLHDVLDVAALHSIVPLVLGSAVLAHDGVLPEDFSDAEQVDLLVDPEEVTTLLDALVAAGFEQVIPAPSDGPDLPVGHEVVRPGELPVRVQLRTRLAVGPFAALVNHEELHDRSVPVRVDRRWWHTLHPEDRFVLTCVQLDLDTSHSTVQDLRDVVLSAPRIEADMAAALEASERWGATTSVVASLQRVDAVMPGLSPWLVERAGRGRTTERASRGLLRRRR